MVLVAEDLIFETTCDQCGAELRYRHAEIRRFEDYGSFFYVVCPHCKNMVEVDG